MRSQILGMKLDLILKKIKNYVLQFQQLTFTNYQENISQSSSSRAYFLSNNRMFNSLFLTINKKEIKWKPIAYFFKLKLAKFSEIRDWEMNWFDRNGQLYQLNRLHRSASIVGQHSPTTFLFYVIIQMDVLIIISYLQQPIIRKNNRTINFSESSLM